MFQEYVSKPSKLKAARFFEKDRDNWKDIVFAHSIVGRRTVYRVVSSQGIVQVDDGDWIACEPNEPFKYYPIKPDVFEQRWQRKED